jgi:hypothetical protein
MSLMKSRPVLRRLRRFLAVFDITDAHFYIGMTMLFLGLWLYHSLGLALIVTGGLVAAVGFVSALFGVFMASKATESRRGGGKR